MKVERRMGEPLSFKNGSYQQLTAPHLKMQDQIAGKKNMKCCHMVNHIVARMGEDMQF